MTNEPTFEKYWQEKKMYFFRYALRQFAYFWSRDSGEWEDAFSVFAREISSSWLTFRGDSSRDTWAFRILERTFFGKIAAFRKMKGLMSNVDDWGTGEDDEPDGPSLGVDLPETEPFVDPDDARKLIAAVDSFLDQCVKRFVKGKQHPMSSEDNVKSVFQLKVVEGDFSGQEIHVITGITPPQQVAVVSTIKMCIEIRARLAGFGEVIQKIKEI